MARSRPGGATGSLQARFSPLARGKNALKHSVPSRKQSGARLATLLCLHDDHWFLPVVLKAIVGRLDLIAFISRIPWHGEPGNWERCVEVAQSSGAKVRLGDWGSEEVHRRSAMVELEGEGYTHALLLDSDEIIEPGLLDSLIKTAQMDLADKVRCYMDTYWQDPMHVIRPRESLAPIVLVKLGAIEHLSIREFSNGREIVLSPDYGLMHHLSYAGPDERIKRKIETWSHRNELLPDWWRRSWLGWKKDPTLTNLHPTHPTAYGFIERIPCPAILMGAVGASDTTVPAPKPEKWPSISIVIPVYGQPEMLAACLTSLSACTDLLHEVLIIDDATPASEAGEVEEAILSYPSARLLRNPSNLGFAGTCNRGAGASTGEVLLFLNSDTQVPRAGLVALVTSLQSSGSIGASGPMTNNAGYYQGIAPTYTDIHRMDLFAADLANSEREDRDVDMLVGFCLAVRRSVLDEVGVFDERFGKGFFEDTDLCYRIARAGYRLRLSSKAFVHHFGSQSITRAVSDPHALLKRNQQIYEQKWAHEISSGFASRLPGLSLNEGVIAFDPDRAPERLDRELAERVQQAEISLCMIVRDEERVLGDCLASARPYFTQIVVVDTGSKDRTMDIARSHGAEVYQMVWPDSFSVARNKSLKFARGKWIFWLDADDTLPRATGEAIVQAALSTQSQLAGLVVPVQFVEEGQAVGTRVDHVKLFRNLPGIRFEFHIHEQILASLRPHGEIARIDAIVLHSGYDTSPEGQRKKRLRDWKLLRLDLAENPNHPFVLFNFGMTHHFCENHRKAVQWLRRSIRNSHETESHVRKAYALLGTSLLRLGRSEEALKSYAEGILRVGGDPELEFLRARLLGDLGRLEEARDAYEAMSTSINGFFSSVDVGILSFKRKHNIAGVRLALGDYAGARQAYLEAIAANPAFSASAEALFDAAFNNGDNQTCREALDALFRACGPSENWVVRGERLEIATGGQEAAERFLLSACNAHPQAPGPALCLARRWCRTAREVQAEPILRGLYEAGYAEAAFYLGVLEIRLGNLERALDWLDKAYALNPDHDETIVQRTRLRQLLS